MHVHDAVHAKRAVREFSSTPISEGDLAAILDAGRRAHSAKNHQRWGFVVVRDRDRLQALSTLGPWCGHIAGAAVAVALVTPDPRAEGASLSVMWDLGGAAAQMMLVAWELGIGSCPATVYEVGRAREMLGYPADMHCEFMLSFGYPAKPEVLTRPNRAGGRKPVEDLVHREAWSASVDAEAGA